MRTGWKQVTSQEYDVLTRFHDGEVRYYVNFESNRHRRKSQTRRHNGMTDSTRTQPGALLMLSVHGKLSYSKGTYAQRITDEVYDMLGNDPTKRISRMKLKDILVNRFAEKGEEDITEIQVGPHISAMTKAGMLRIVEQ